MIKSLSIQNYAIIESLEIDFSKGLTIITGETGAGKSILLGALGLIMGQRADTKSLYDLERKCSIEAIFDVSAYKLKSFFQENDLDYDKELVIRREITPSGKSRAFVNDTPTNLKVLQQLSAALIDLHQQFDTLDIHEVSFQLRMLDALADNAKLLAKYEGRYASYQQNRRMLGKLRDQDATAHRESEFLQFQFNELSEGELIDGEQEQLEGELATLNNAEEIKRTLSGAFQHLLESEQSVISQLEQLNLSVAQIKDFHPKLDGCQGRFQGLIFELEELAKEFEEIAESTEYNPERIQEVNERLDLIYRLQTKHQVGSVKELLEIQHDLEQKLQGFNDISQQLLDLEKQLEEDKESLRQWADKLRERRQKVIPSFEKKILKLLGHMSMEHAQLRIELSGREDFGPTGLDEVQYLFAANKGGRMQLIKDVASGGEISRLTLVTKSLVASAIPLPTLIFDEIDTGISGDVALRMGDILRKLSNDHQVVSITHSPQIASKADAHYFVYKQIKDERTLTKVRSLSLEERIRAIAVMLSQNPPSEAALDNARELIEQS
ncbi:MAG: DNA repair protein RecN [Bacteroidota bacterium]